MQRVGRHRGNDADRDGQRAQLGVARARQRLGAKQRVENGRGRTLPGEPGPEPDGGELIAKRGRPCQHQPTDKGGEVEGKPDRDRAAE
jgi:hypothetical protein